MSELLATVASWLDLRLFNVGPTAITGASVLTFTVILGLTYWMSLVLQRVIARLLSSTGLGRADTVATTSRLLHYAVLFVGLAVAMQAIGVSLATVFAAGAVAAVAIGFALQNILQNFVSGLILLAERSITETDVLEVEGTVVRIMKLGARATVAKTREDEELIIPNSILVQSTVTNLTLTDEVYRIRSTVGVGYDSDMQAVEETLTRVAQGVKGRAESKEPLVYLTEFGDSAVVWEVSIWAVDPWRAPLANSDLNKAIWYGLKEAGISIAYPQLDLHVRSGLPPAAGSIGLA